MRDNDYINEPFVKVIYQSEPIGKEKIILKLTTFDTNFYEEVKKPAEIKFGISTKEFSQQLQLFNNSMNYQQIYQLIENELNVRVDNFYKEEIIKLRKENENLHNIMRKISSFSIEEKDICGNVVNTDKVSAHTIKGNVVNCGTVIVNKIEGKITNCEIKYK